MTERLLAVAWAQRANSSVWPQIEPAVTWDEFLSWLDPRNPRQEKECGGYVGGLLRDGVRDSRHVESRSIIVLDADYAEVGFSLETRLVLDGYAQIGHTTWRHTPEAPRYRVILPLSRDVSPAEYKRICWALMNELGVAQFDPSCPQPERFMWRPSTQDVETYDWWIQPGDLLDVDVWLGKVQEPEDDWDGEAPRAEIDLDQPASQAQIEKAWAVLDKACRELEDPSSYGGRNDACIRWLPILYRFALGGCFEKDEVDERCWTAVRSAPGDHDFPEAEFQAVARQALKYAEADGPDRPMADDPTEDFTALEKSLFDQTPVLKHIQTAAYAAGLSAMPMLCCVLGRILTEVPPNYVLPGAKDGVVGDRASLNLGWAFVGQSGTGKTSTLQLSQELLGIDQSFIQRTPSTGQGLIQSFLKWDPDLQTNVVGEDPRRLFNVDEIGQLAAHKDSSGSTLGPELRSMLMGAQTGSENASKGLSRVLPASSYRMQLFVGVQPTRSHTLLKDEDAGLPQRFVWSKMISKDIPHPDDRPAWPGPLDWDGANLEFGTDEQIVIDYPDDIKQRMVTDRWLSSTSEDHDSLESHLNLTRLKVAAALALLHGEDKITDRWWAIAELIGRLSLLAQAYCVKELGDVAHQSRVAILQAEERAIDTVEERRIQRLVETAKTKIIRAAGEWLTATDLRPAHRDRQHTDEIWDRLAIDPELDVEEYEIPNGHTAKRARIK